MPGEPNTILVTPDDWDRVVADTEGPQLFLAGPGAGKTEFLARRAQHLIDSGATAGPAVLMLTFSRRAAADLRSRVGRALRPGTAPPHSATFHSLAFRILEAHAPSVLGWARMPALLTGPEYVGVIRGLLASESPSSWPAGFRELLTTRSFAEEVADFLMRSSERLLSPDDIRSLATERTDWQALPAFMERVSDALESKGRIDYAGVLSSAMEVLRDSAARGALTEQFSHVLVDEYQDTTDAQAELLRLLVAGHGNISVTADVDQSIYSFRGTDLRNVERFTSMFGGEVEARTFTLTTSYRVPEEILEAARRLAVPGLPGAVEVVEPSGPGGRVDVHVFDQQSHEAEWIAAELQRLHLEHGTPYQEMAVLLRTKRRLLPELSRALDRRKIPHDRPDTRLIDHPAIRIVADLVTLSMGDASPTDLERALRRLLLGPLVGLSLGAERSLVRAWQRGEGRWEDLIADRVSDGSAIADLIDDPAWATEQTAEQGFWHAWQSLPHWERLVTDPRREGFRAALASFSQVLGHLAERDPALSLADFLDLATDDSFEASTLLRYRDESDLLTLTTLHQAKGLEFEVVVIADAVDGVLPDLRRSFSLLNTNQLHPDQQGKERAARFRIEEERRLAYTAMTRARSRVIWTATGAGVEETESRPSRFLTDITGGREPGLPEPSSTRPVNGLEAESLLRRTATDPGLPAPARLAAVSIIAANPHDAVRPAADFAGVRTPGPDTGLIGADARFSPSQATSYDACPRQYVLGRHLRIGDTPSVYMYQGSLVHKVAETLDQRVLDDPDHQPTTAEALEILDAVFDPSEFGGEPWAQAWKVRATEIITRLLELSPPGGAVAFVERPLQLILDGEVWRGRADRIDHSPSGGPRVVDYKTGTSVATRAEAASSLQLGFYVLAASEDPDITALGPVSGAELWYPAAKPNKNAIQTRPFDMEHLPEVRDRLAEIAASIRDEEFAPRVGSHCRSCRVKIVCPEWPEGEEAFTP